MIPAPPATTDDAITGFLADPVLVGMVAAHRVIEPQPPRYAPFPKGLDARLRAALGQRGVEALYTHQAAAVAAINLSRGMWAYELKTLPRPRGRETQVIYTTWDLPVTARPAFR